MNRFQRSLILHVSQSSNINDVVSIFSFIPVDVVKQFLTQQIKLLNSNTCKTACYKSLSIEHTLPSAVIQHCLSFTHDDNIPLVNKSFNDHFNQNQRILLRKLHNIANASNIPNTMSFDPSKNKTLVVDKSRTKLNESELKEQYIGPFQYFGDALGKCNDGDKILLHGTCDNGPRENQKSEHVFWSVANKNVQIIGIGNDAVLKDVTNHDYTIYLQKSANVYFENITFDSVECIDLIDAFFYMEGNATLSMQNCNIKFGHIGIFLLGESRLFANNCRFDGGSLGVSAIHLQNTGGAVNALGCVFTGSGHKHANYSLGAGSCIDVVPANEYDDENDASDPKSRIRCIANIFKNNHGYPIALRATRVYVRYSLGMDFAQPHSQVDCVINSNVMQGSNGINVEKIVNDCNKLYFNTQPYA